MSDAPAPLPSPAPEPSDAVAVPDPQAIIAANSEYTDKDLLHLSDLEHVRERPGMYIGAGLSAGGPPMLCEMGQIRKKSRQIRRTSRVLTLS